jgi:hypothetical protein
MAAVLSSEDVMELNEVDQPALSVTVVLDIELGGSDAGMARELLYISERPTTFGQDTSSASDERAPP